MNAIEEKCKAKGVRLTDQRRIIAQVMSDSKEKYGAKDHPDVDELHKRVSEVDSKIIESSSAPKGSFCPCHFQMRVGSVGQCGRAVDTLFTLRKSHQFVDGGAGDT